MSTAAAAPAKGLSDTHAGFGLVSRTLHWGMALLFAWQFTGALIAVFAGNSAPAAFFWATHYSVGFTLFVLVLLRGAWGLANLGNRPPHAGPAFERFAATVGQVVLYVLMVAVPSLMIYRAVASDRGFRVYGVQLVEAGAEPIRSPFFSAVATTHVWLAWIFLGLIVLHAGIALYHAFVRRDATLDRMVKGESRRPLNPGTQQL